jgi:transposase InsO family protein
MARPSDHWLVFAEARSAGQVREALLMAMHSHTTTAESIFHSDQGCEYASEENRRVLGAFGLQVSMSRNGTAGTMPTWNRSFPG